MKKGLYRKGEELVRVLKVEEDKLFIVDCKKKIMPCWIDREIVEEYEECGEDALERDYENMECLGEESKAIAYKNYTLIVD